MLSFSEIITYELGTILASLIFIILGTLCFGAFLKEKEDDGLKILCAIIVIVTIFILSITGAIIWYGTISLGSVIPCSISTVEGYSCNLVADTSEHVYRVCNQEASMKLRVNITRDVVIYDRFNPFANGHPEIIEVKGSFCPSGVATGC